jgi:hypothetical protein
LPGQGIVSGRFIHPFLKQGMGRRKELCGSMEIHEGMGSYREFFLEGMNTCSTGRDQLLHSGQRSLGYPPILPFGDITTCHTWTCLARKAPARESR